MTIKNTSIIIRVGSATLDFLTAKDTVDSPTEAYIPYPVKSGMSMAANLRQAFRENEELTANPASARLLVDTPSLLVPIEEYRELSSLEDFDVDAFYGDVITGHKGEVKIVTEIPELDVVNIFPVNADLQMVVTDHFRDVSTENIMTAVWLELYRKYFQGSGPRRLFVYFHDRVMDVCSFDQHRIRFANNFSVSHAHDALYYTLYVWKQLGMRQQEDELFVLGDIINPEWLTERLKAYVSKVNIIDYPQDHEEEPFDLTLCE